MTDFSKHHPSPKNNRALAITSLLILLLIAVVTSIYLWAKNDTDSAYAKHLRDWIGIRATGEEPAQTKTPVIEPVKAPEPVQDSPATDEIQAEVKPLNQLAWKDFVQRKKLWPETLEIVIDQVIPVRYRSRNYGEMIFVPGQKMDIIDITANGQIIGSINNNELSITIEATNLIEWFSQKHRSYDELLLPSAQDASTQPSRVSQSNDTDPQEVLIARMRVWSMTNYDTPLLDITEDGLVLRWLPKEETEIDFRLEAREIARNYLRISAELGNLCNYAVCEIRDPATGDLLGSNGIFIPKL